MKLSELALYAHRALHSSASELVLENTRWTIRIVPREGVRCVAVYAGPHQFYFQQQDPWDMEKKPEFALLARMGHKITWVRERLNGKHSVSLVIDGDWIENPESVFATVQ